MTDSVDILASLAGTPANSTPVSTETATTEASNSDNATTEANSNSTNEATTETANTDTPEYGDLRGTFATMDEAEAAGFGDLITEKAFADALTVRNVLAGKMADGIVPVQNIYNAVKAKRHPIPVVLVDGNRYVPQAQATEAWDNRPERGEGSGSTSGTLTDERLALLTFQVQDKVNAANRRLKVLQDKIAKDTKTMEKRNAQALARFGDNWQDVVNKAGEDAEKSKEITDDESATSTAEASE